MDWEAIRLSFKLAFWTSFILLVFGVPLSYGLARSRWRFRFVLEAVIALPLVLPPTVLGFYVLMAIGPQSPVGYFYEKFMGGLLPFSFTGLLIGSVLYSLPFAIQPFLAAFSTIDQKLLEASWCLGVSPWKTFFRLTLPLSLPGILTGVVLSYAHTLGEFGMVLMIGGDIPGVTRTISVSIYDQVQSLNYEMAGKSSAFLLILAFTVLATTSLLRRKSIQVWVQSSSM